MTLNLSYMLLSSHHFFCFSPHLRTGYKMLNPSVLHCSHFLVNTSIKAVTPKTNPIVKNKYNITLPLFPKFVDSIFNERQVQKYNIFVTVLI